MADEFRTRRELARHRGALLAGQEPRRPVARSRSPGAGRPADVAPGTRPAKPTAPKRRPWWQAARRVPRLFAPGLRKVAR